ncbi:TPA: type II toxin-antitoxin system RelE/ParE family toxin, partial [Vibrio cholerae]|nr:type II toxin-antitoxin system RelE/ParE family toxin [Vibrio cholerae]
MAEIVWTEPALSDLNDIAEYIALENVVAAKQLVQTIFTKVERLADFP